MKHIRDKIIKIIIYLLSNIYHIIKGDSLFIMKRRGLTVGKRFSLGNGHLDLSFPYLIKIGDDVTLGGNNVTILAHDASTKYFLNYTRIGKVVIGNRVFIGSGSTILPGVTIGDDVVIGAGSLVVNDIPAHSVAMGNPATVKFTIEEFIDRKRQEMGKYPLFNKEYKVNTRTKEILDDIRDKFGYIV